MSKSFVLRGIIVLVVDAIALYLMLDNKVDFLFKTFIIYGVAIALAWFTHGFLYGVFAGKKAVEAAGTQLKNTSVSQPGGSSPRSRAIGYWIMQAIILAAFLAVTILKHIEIAGM